MADSGNRESDRSMTVRVLSTRQLNRSVLARQLLLERSTMPLTRAVERVAGLQTQYAPSAYIGLWSRLQGFRRPALTRALEQRRVVEATLMRTTIHVVSARDFPVFVAGVREARRAWWMRIHGKEVEGLTMQAVADRVRRHLALGPLRARRLMELLRDDGFPPIVWQGVGLWLDMVRVPPSGTWEQRRADLFGLAEDWLGPGTASATSTATAGVEHLVRRYLGGFGPAGVDNIANWAGLPITMVRPVVERSGLRRFRDEQGHELVDVPRGPLPDPDAPAPVRFLPTYDNTLLGHARRTQILPERYRSLVFHTKMPQSVATFLVDGAVAGIWRYEGGRVRLEPFDPPLPRLVRRDLEDEAERLAAFHGD
jgi:hypothetical protein